MTVKLWINWRGREILTTQQLEEKIDEMVESILSNEDSYREELEDYLDYNYTKIELFEALMSDGATIEEVIDDIKSGVAENIRDWCDSTTRSDYEEVKVEI